MDPARFATEMDAAVVDARALWHGAGQVVVDATEVVVRRKGTGVHVVSVRTDGNPNVAAHMARALGRRIAGRLPPQGTQAKRTVAADSAHARMAVAALVARKTQR